MHYKHKRDNLLNSCKSFYNFCELLLKKSNIRKWVKKLSNKLDIKEEIIDIYIKNNISGHIDFNKNNSSINNLQLRYIIIDIFKSALFLISIFLFRNKKNNKLNKKYKLIIDNIESSDELSRYNNLISFFNIKEVVVLSKKKNIKNVNNIKIIYKKRFRNYSLTFNDLLIFIKLMLESIKYSFITRINLINIYSSIVDSYLYYKSFFEEFQADNIIMHQHYHTNSIKNAIFKKYNGKKTYTIQKNIHQLGKNCFYYNSDFLLTFGKLTSQRAKIFGGSFKEVIVGSFFMEHFFYNNKIKNKYEKFDILLLGGNSFKKNGPFDTYNNQYDQYVEHLKWVCDYSELNPSAKIGFKAHSNFDFKNTIEYEIFKNSNIMIVDKNLNSYHLCNNSKILLSYASTMIIEMYGLNQNSFFLDPNNCNDQFLDNIEDWNKLRINTFNEFNKLISDILKNDVQMKKNFQKNSFCEESSNVSKKIFNHMMLKN